MAVRASMQTDLIPRVRTLIADPSGSSQFSDQQIQDAMDFRRTEARYVALRPMPTFAPGNNSILYLDYYSDAQNWEADVVLQDLSYNTLTPSLSEYIVGHWSFATQPTGIGVRATGKVYDIYGSSADLLASWAAAVKLDFDFGTDEQRFDRTDKFNLLTALAKQYRALAQTKVSRLVQSDAAPDHDGGGIVYPNVNMAGW